MIPGRSASPGIAIGKAVVIQHQAFDIDFVKVGDVELEIARFQRAITASRLDLQRIFQKAQIDMGAEEASIFEAHLMLIDDPELLDQTTQRIKSESMNAEFAFQAVVNQFIAAFEAMDNEYMRARVTDIQDISHRVLSHLKGREFIDLSSFDEDVVVLADDLTPSEFATMDLKHVVGFVTEKGGRTSHVAIMARTLEIPAVVGARGVLEGAQKDDLIVFDGDVGEVFANPDVSTIEKFKNLKFSFDNLKKELIEFKGQESITLDGRKVTLAANIGSPADIDVLKRNDAEGVGLFRTEFLFMNRTHMPNEDEQYLAYQEVLKACGEHMAVIRTLDIGGDKKLPYLEMDHEENPFLGNRAIRLCLQHKDIFKTQLRALLRASVSGKLAIMFPMISSLDELLEAKALLEESKKELLSEGKTFSEKIQVGIMIEVPSAALISDVLAKHCDFFSIGTNDLIQYTCAVDRMNKNLESLYSPYHPGVLRLIRMVIDNGHNEKIWVGVCGEVGGKADLVPLLMGMGLDEFSMSPPSILPIRKLVRSLNYDELKTKVSAILALSTSAEVEKAVSTLL